MERELLVSKLKERITNVGITDKTLDAYVDSIMPFITNDEMVNDAFLDGCKKFLVANRGQMTHEVSEEVNRYKGEWEKNHPTDPPVPPVPPPAPPVVPDLLKRVEEMELKLQKREAEAATEELRRKVMEGMRAKGANDDYVLRNAMRNVELDGKKSVDELVEACLPNYDNELRECRGDGATPRSGNRGGQGGGGELDGFFDRMRAEGKFPAKN